MVDFEAQTAQRHPSRRLQTMNRKRVVVWMTIGVGIVLLVMTFVLLGAVPPWPVWLFFALSHGFFCAVVWRVKPYPGPHVQPVPDITVPVRSQPPRSDS